MPDSSAAFIETGVDKLLQLVERQGEVSVSDAAKSLKVSREVVEHWADALEEAKLLSVQYTVKERYLQSREQCALHRGSVGGLRGHLKSLFADTKPADADLLAKREQQLAAREHAVAKKLHELSGLEKDRARLRLLEEELSRRSKAAEAKEKHAHRAVEEAAASLKKMEHEARKLKAAAESISVREAALKVQTKSVSQERRELKLRAAALERRERAAASDEKAAAERKETVQRLLADLQQRERKALKAERRREALVAALAAQRESLARKEAALAGVIGSVRRSSDDIPKLMPVDEVGAMLRRIKARQQEVHSLERAPAQPGPSLDQADAAPASDSKAPPQ